MTSQAHAVNPEMNSSGINTNDGSKEIDLKLLFNKIQVDEPILAKVRGGDLILFLGRTGAGKTTTICFVAGDTLIVRMRTFQSSDGTSLFESVLEAEVPLDRFAIGHTLDSTTKSINIRPLPGSQSILTDSCGFLDTEGVTVDVANAISLRNAMHMCSLLRPVILIDARIISADKGGSFGSLLDLIIRFFTPIREFLPNMTFLFTHGEADLNAGKLKTALGKLSNSVHVQKDPEKLAIVEHLFKYVNKYSNRCILLSEELVSPHGASQKRDDLLALIMQPAALSQDLISQLGCPISEEAQNILQVKCDEIHLSIIRLLEQFDYRQILDHLDNLQLLESSIQLPFVTEVWKTCLNVTVSHLDDLVQLIDLNYEEGNYESLGMNLNHCRVSQCLKCFKDLSEDYYRIVRILNEHVVNLSNIILNCTNFYQNTNDIADALRRLKLIQRHLRFVLIEDAQKPQGYDYVVSQIESHLATINTRCESLLSFLDRMILSSLGSENEILNENSEFILLLNKHPPEDLHSPSFAISVLFDDLNELKSGGDYKGHLSPTTIAYHDSRIDQLLTTLQTAHTNMMGDAGLLCDIENLSLTPQKSRELFRTHDLLQICYHHGANDCVGCSLYDFPSNFVEEVINLCTSTLNQIDTYLIHSDYAAMEIPFRVLTSLELNDSHFLVFKSSQLFPKIKMVKDHLKMLYETCSINLNAIRTTNSVETSEYHSTAKSLSYLRSSCCLDFLYSVHHDGDISTPSCCCSELASLISQDWTKRMSNFLSIIATEDSSTLNQFFSQLEIMIPLSVFLEDVSADIQRIVSSFERVADDLLVQNSPEKCPLNEKYLIRSEVYILFLSQNCRTSLLFSKFFPSHETWSDGLQNKLSDWQSAIVLAIRQRIDEAEKKCMEAVETKNAIDLRTNLELLRNLCCFDDFIDPSCSAIYGETRSILQTKLEKLFETGKALTRRNALDDACAIRAFLEDISSLRADHFPDIDFRSEVDSLSKNYHDVVENIPKAVERLLELKKFKRIKTKMMNIQESSPDVFDDCDLHLTEFFESLSETLERDLLEPTMDAETIDRLSKNMKVIRDAQELSEVASFDLVGLYSSASSSISQLYSKLQRSFIIYMNMYQFGSASRVFDQINRFKKFDAVSSSSSSSYADLLESLSETHIEHLKTKLEDECKSILKDSVPAPNPNANANGENDFMVVDFDLNKLSMLFQSVSSESFFQELVDFSAIQNSLNALASNHLQTQLSEIQKFINHKDLDIAESALNICRNIFACCEASLPPHSATYLRTKLEKGETNLVAARGADQIQMIFQAKYMDRIQNQFELLKQDGFATYNDAYRQFLGTFEEESTKINALIDGKDFSIIDRFNLGSLINFTEALIAFKAKIVPDNDHTTRESCDILMRRLEGFFFQFCSYWRGALSESSAVTVPHILISLLSVSKSQISPIFENQVEFFRLVESIQKAIEEKNVMLKISYEEVAKYDLFTSRSTDDLMNQLEFLRKQRVVELPRIYTFSHLPPSRDRHGEEGFDKALTLLRSSLSRAPQRLENYLEIEDFASASLGMSNLSILGQFSDLSEDCNIVDKKFREQINRLTEDLVRSVSNMVRNEEDDNDDGKQLARLISTASLLDESFRNCMRERKPAMNEINGFFRDKIGRIVSFSTANVTSVTLEEHSRTILAVTELVSEISNSSVRSLVKESIDRYLNHLKDSKLNLSKLGSLLSEQGPAGAAVIANHTQFKGNQVKIINESTAGIHIDHALSELKQLNEISESQLNRLKKVHDKYSEKYEGFLKRFLSGYGDVDGTECVQSLDELVVEIEQMALDPQDRMVELLAGIFALWTIMDSGDLFQEYAEKIYLIRPHAVQLIAIFRLLGMDQETSLFSSLMHLVTGCSSRNLSGHLIQVGTGEGKSILLAGLSCVLALLGYEVCCASYSQYLSDRDAAMFRSLFEKLNISSKIKYSTLGGLVEQVIQGGDLRSQVHDTLVPNTNSSKKSKKSNKSPKKIPRILLIDEVDVFFSSDFFGVTYNPVSMISSPEIEAIFRYIWSTRNNLHSPTLAEIRTLPDYCTIVSQFTPEAPQLIDLHIQRMLNDVNNFSQRPYEVVENEDGTWKIGYKKLDTVDCNLYFGYRTAFAYLHESSKRAEISLRDVLSMSVSCGSFSYAEIPCSGEDSPFQCIMGVTGTLDSLIDEEKLIVKDKYGLTNYTFTPSMYGRSKLLFRLVADVIMETDVNRYYQTILKEITDEREKGRPVLVYFESEEKLNEFLDSSYGSQLNDVNIVTEKTRDIPFYVEKATHAQKVTLLTRAFGRGLDFKSLDVAVDTAGGVHVIQTFFSEFLSEEIQIKGRTARQSKKGSYKMILLASDLEKRLKMTMEELTQSLETGKFYETIHAKRVELLAASVKSQSTQAERSKELHKRSYQFMRDLRSGQCTSAKLFDQIMSFA